MIVKHFLIFLMLGIFGTLVLACSPMNRWTKINRQTAQTFHDGDYTRAIDLANHSLKLARTKFGQDHHYASIALNNLIFLYTLTGSYKKAEALLYQAIALKELHLEPLSLQTGMLLTSLSELYRFEGGYKQASYYGTRGLFILKKQLTENHPLILEALNNLAFVYEAQNEDKKAEALYINILSRQENLLGSDHPDLKPHLSNLENIYRRQGKYAEAIILSERALSLSNKHSAARYDYGQSLFNLASLYMDSFRYEKAEPLTNQLIEYDRKHLGKLHPRVALDMDLLARIYVAQNKPAAAKLLYKKAMLIQANKLAADHPHRKQVQLHYNELVMKLNKKNPIKKFNASTPK